MDDKMFQEAFRNGSTLKSGPVEVTMRCHEVGQLSVPSGRIVACDPIEFTAPEPFSQGITPGSYPVLLSIAQARTSGGQRVAYAMISIEEGTPARWEMAGLKGRSPTWSRGVNKSAYAVDTGLGCFMDLRAAKLLLQKMSEDADYYYKVFDAVEGNYPEMGEHTLDFASDLNLIAFESGFGGGLYTSWWGYTETGEVACLVTDFNLLGEAGEGYRVREWK
jgi:hypothetical protein